MLGAPVLYSCHFGGGQFTQLAKVLELTAARHCPLWDRRIEQIGSHTVRAAEESYAANTHKLDRWNAVVQALPDGARCLLIDTDTFIVRSLEDIWQDEFDVAYTVRQPGYKLPLNGGVVFLRAHSGARAFMREWADVNRKMLADRQLHKKWMRKFGGINQAALGYVLSSVRPERVMLKMLPCQEWNCEDSTWASFSPSTRIVHVKSALRLAAFNLTAPKPHVRPLLKLWRVLERESVGLPT